MLVAPEQVIEIGPQVKHSLLPKSIKDWTVADDAPCLPALEPMFPGELRWEELERTREGLDGEYPDWPVSGAQKIEMAALGLPMVSTWVEARYWIKREKARRAGKLVREPRGLVATSDDLPTEAEYQFWRELAENVGYLRAVQDEASLGMTTAPTRDELAEAS